MPRRGRGRPPHPDVLTPTEWSVLDLIRHGMGRREIARRRGTSLDAVKYHVANIVGKLGAERPADLRRWPGIPVDSALHGTKGRIGMTGTDTKGALGLGSIGQVSLLARDIGRAEAFFRDTLGLGHLYTYGDLAFFDADGTRIFLRAVPEDEWHPSSILYFRVDEITAAHRALAASGVHFQGEPHRIHTHDDGTEEWMAFFEDSEGNTLALMSQLRPG